MAAYSVLISNSAPHLFWFSVWNHINSSGHKLILFPSWCWLWFYWLWNEVFVKISPHLIDFTKYLQFNVNFFLDSIPASCISRIWIGFLTFDKISPISWTLHSRKQGISYGRQNKEVSLGNNDDQNGLRGKFWQTMKKLGYCCDWLCTIPSPPS